MHESRYRDPFGRHGFRNGAARRPFGLCRASEPQHPLADVVGGGPDRRRRRARARDLARERSRLRRGRHRQCAGAARLRPDLGRRSHFRRPQGAAAGRRLRAHPVAARLPYPGFCARHQPARRGALGDAGDAGRGHCRGVLARARRAADVAMADRHRPPGLCGGAARAHPGQLLFAAARQPVAGFRSRCWLSARCCSQW